MTSKRSYLKKSKLDFQKENKEIPEELIRDSDTLGKVMTDEDLADWLTETDKVFSILLEDSPATFKRLYNEYVLDIDYLLELKRINKEQADQLKNIERFKF